MNLARTLLAAVLVLIAPAALARQISEGVYSLTWVSPVAGQCLDCEVRIRKVTPHIVELTANNGWSGFAYYVAREDRYQGTLESWAGEGGPYAEVLFSIELKFDGQRLTMNASSEPLKFVAVYKKAAPAPREAAL
jgi:hypothetical protein